MTTLFVKKGTRYRPADPSQILGVAERLVTEPLIKGEAMTSPEVAQRLASLRLASLESEVFSVMYLDTRHRLISFDDMFKGTIDGTSVYPREVVKAALKHNAAAVILVHNHPSGVTEPSLADRTITVRLKEALALIEVRVLDHLIVAKGGTTTSLAAVGWI